MPISRSPTIVACVDHASVNGGQAKVAIESLIGLRRVGARAILFAAVGPADPRLAEAGVEVICLGQNDLLGNSSLAAGALQGSWNEPARRALAALLASLPPDDTVVHVHGWAKALSPSIASAIRGSGLPAAWTIHEYFLFCPNGGFYDYQKQAVCPIRPLSMQCLATNCDSRSYAHKIWRSARLFAAREILHMPEVFSDYICISAHQEEIVAPYLPVNARVHRLSNPIEAEDLGPKPDAASGGPIFVGRLSPEKGPALFAEAATRAGFTPSFVGDGPLAEQLKADYPDALFLGWRSPEEVRGHMRAARALVFPSMWYEGQPLTVLEAKAMGTPVLVSDICAGREEIEDGDSGLWFASGDVGALTRALERLKDDALTRRLSDGAYESYWTDPPTLDAHVGRVMAIYGGMLERRRPAPAAPPRESEVRNRKTEVRRQKQSAGLAR